jgi:hypothetical protein
MPNPQAMFQTEKYDNSSTNRQNRLSHVKRKRLALLSKPRRWKPGAVNVFFHGVGLKYHAFFVSETCMDGMQWV